MLYKVNTKLDAFFVIVLLTNGLKSFSAISLWLNNILSGQDSLIH